MGLLRPLPCSACHIPIQPAHIKAQLEPKPEPDAESSEQDDQPAAEEAAEAEV